MSRREQPVIGITSYVEPASWGAWTEVPAALVPNAYVEHVRRAGGAPGGRPAAGRRGDARTTRGSCWRRLDGLVLAGGRRRRVQPLRRTSRTSSAQEPRPRPRRRGADLLARAARDAVPVLGVCRGMQVMVVAAGGAARAAPARPARLASTTRRRPGTVRPARRRDRAGQPAALDRSAIGSRSTATTTRASPLIRRTRSRRSATDGVIEAIEAPGPSFHLGVQWHPETGSDGRLFEALVGAAR